jgi:hypothetical protein
LRTETRGNAAQGDKLASAVNEVKSAPRSDGTASADLSGIDERIAKIESQMRTQSAEIAQQGSKLAMRRRRQACRRHGAAPPGVGRAARCSVRIGEPYPVALAATKALAPNPDVLKPLDQFAEKGVPNAGRLSSELLALVPKLSPAASRAPPRPARASSSAAGGRRQTGQDRTHRHRRHRSRRRGGADHRGCAAK